MEAPVSITVAKIKLELSKTTLEANCKPIVRVIIECRIYQGDALSPLLFCIGPNPLSKIITKSCTQSWARERFQLWINDQRSYHVVYPYKYHFILDQLEKCGQHNPFLVLIVPVAPHHMEARAAIRKTWGNDSLVQKGVVLVLFLLGLPSGKHSEALQAHVHQENMHHRDLLQSNFIDSYRNLTIKTMVMLEWLTEHCPHAHYAVKVDADILLNIKGLMKMLRSPYVLQNNYITGQVWYNNIVIRDPANKFYIPFSVYPHFVYPPYPLGMCYIMSMDLPKKILQVSKEIKPIFIEDAYIGLCLERLHIAPVNPPNPAQFVVSPPSWYSRCYYANLIAVVTDNPDELVYYWKDITKYGSLC
ncbi:beta-1,3-galactosyltransferase 2-like [Electrophorus electricus]|uniref:beta-1,3-galactosyltransferase 2-like n=1 Tax=Electrophorus electricus TaxID=8005 RepID=UPI0015D0BEC0|nr:beta-1,3-galactosyltransferase 2-like [Electrophorus electricus]